MKISLKNLSIISALIHSLDGLKYLIKERAFVQEIIFGIAVCMSLLLSSSPLMNKLYVFSSYCLILIIEALNTSVETTVNRISMQKHPLSKKAKDIGSAAVFIAMVHFAITFIVLIGF